MPEENKAAEQGENPNAVRPYLADAKARQADQNEGLWASVDEQIAANGGRDKGWGKANSMAVIEYAIQIDAEYIAAHSEASAECKGVIDLVVNPSAFRQVLESKDVGKLDKPAESAKGKRSAFLKTVK